MRSLVPNLELRLRGDLQIPSRDFDFNILVASLADIITGTEPTRINATKAFFSNLAWPVSPAAQSHQPLFRLNACTGVDPSSKESTL